MKAKRGTLNIKGRGKYGFVPRFSEGMPLLVKRRLVRRFEAMMVEIDGLMGDVMNRAEGNPAGLKAHPPKADYSGDFEFFVAPNWTHMLVEGGKYDV